MLKKFSFFQDGKRERRKWGSFPKMRKGDDEEEKGGTLKPKGKGEKKKRLFTNCLDKERGKLRFLYRKERDLVRRGKRLGKGKKRGKKSCTP